MRSRLDRFMKVKVSSGVVEGAPIVVCRVWRSGDELRGLRGVPCMVARCPHMVAVTDFKLGTGYICFADAEGYGLAPKGIAAADAADAGRDLP